MKSENFYFYRGNHVNLSLIDNAKLIIPARGVNPFSVSTRLAKSGRLFIDSNAPRGCLIVRGTPEKIKELKSYGDIQSTLSAYLTDDNRELILTDEILVKFADTVSSNVANTILKSAGCTIIRQSGGVYIARVINPKDDAPLTVANNLTALQKVVFAEPNAIQTLRFEEVIPPQDELFIDQWHLNNTGQFGGTAGADVRALAAWDITYGHPDVKIVIHDTGLDIGHPDLKPNIIAGWDFDNDDDNPENTDDAHGTGCAGVAAAAINGQGVVGIAPKCLIVPLRMTGTHLFSKIAESITWAAKHGSIVSCSWSSPPSETVSDAIIKAVREERSGQGTLFFFATGNDSSSSIVFPAMLTEVIAVGASTDFDTRAPYSNYGSGIHILAPSSGGAHWVKTTDIRGSKGYSIMDYCLFGGTSSATALCAGVGALMLSANPALSAIEIKRIIAETADKIDVTNHPYATPMVGHKVQQYDWSSGWSTVEFFTSGVNVYIFLLKQADGIVHIHKMNADGTVGTKVVEYDWSGGWTTGKFFTSGANTYLFLLKQGDGVVHIHKMNADGTVGAQINEYDWSSGWTTAEFFTIGSNTYLFLLKQADGIVHIHKMNVDGTVGTQVKEYGWSSGWSTAEFFTIGANTFLFLLKQGDGIVHIHKMNTDGTIGIQIKEYNWSIGWTTAEFLTIGVNTYLFLLKQEDGFVHIHKMNADGTVGNRIKEYDWSSGWTTAEFFTSANTYLFLLKQGDGTVIIHQIETISWNEEYGYGRVNAQRAVEKSYALRPQGAIGHEIERYDWSSGWTAAEFFKSGANIYLFLLKQGDGNVHIHKMNADGTVGIQIKEYKWSGGWTTVEFFTEGANTYLFLLKQGDGIVHIHKMNADGSVGVQIKEYKWSSGWTAVKFFVIGANTYLFLLKQGDGIVHVHKMNVDGTVGAQVIEYSWSGGWTTTEFYVIGANTYLFLLKQLDGTVHIHKMNADGTVGMQIKEYKWSGGWTKAEFFTSATNTCLFLLKQGDGTVHIHDIIG